MELEGISKACRINVMMNKPVTRTPAREARNSTVVSLGFSSSTTIFSFLDTFGIRFRRISSRTSSLAHQPESPFPASYLEQMRDRVGKVIKSITHTWRAGKIVGQSARRPEIGRASCRERG